MIWWLVDHANGVYVLLTVAALVVGALYWQNRRTKQLIALGGIIALVGLLWLLSRLFVTDRMQIRQNMDAMAQATLDRQPDKLKGHLSPTFDFQGLKYDEVADIVVGTAKAHSVNHFRIWDFNVDELSRQKNHAKASFRLRIDTPTQQYFILCRGTFALEKECWNLRTMHVCNLVVDTETPLQVPFHR